MINNSVHRLEMMELRDLLDKEYMKQKGSLKARLLESRQIKLAELRAALLEATRVELQSKVFPSYISYYNLTIAHVCPTSQ
jgi:hypothetical protein